MSILEGDLHEPTKTTLLFRFCEYVLLKKVMAICNEKDVSVAIRMAK